MKLWIAAIVASLFLTGCSFWNQTVDLGPIREQINRGRMDLANLELLAQRYPEAAGAVATARKTLEESEARLAELEKANGNPPAWLAAVTAAWPVAARILTLIPGVGSAIPIADMAFKFLATRRQREIDRAAYDALKKVSP